MFELEVVEDEITIGEAMAIANRLFGADRANVFRQHGLWHVGRFLDDGVYHEGPNKGRAVPPYHRAQEIFGVARKMREAFRFALGTGRVYSGAGGPRGLPEGTRGHRPVIDNRGRIIGWESPGGLFSKSFPSSRIITH
jgi:hypothetical protein